MSRWGDPEELLSVLHELGFVDWQTLRKGYQLGALARDQLVQVADAQIARSPMPSNHLVSISAGAITELEESLDGLVEAEAPLDKRVVDDRWRLTLLLHIRRTEAPDEALLKRVAEVYGQFEYPRDMRGAVYYVPPGPEAYGADVGTQLQSPVEALDALIAELKDALCTS